VERSRRIGRCLGTLALALATMAMLAASAAASEAQITEAKRIAPRVVELTIDTPAFVEPTHVDVDLPNGYDSEPTRRWPVAYFLAGTQNTYKSFNSVVHGVALTENFPALVVSPNGDSGYWSDWWNGGAEGPPEYESFVIEELIPLIDREFRTIPDRAHRAIAGVSMGGYGSMMLAARHPDLFADAATISGAVDSNRPELAAALTASSSLQGAAPDAIYGPRATQEVRWRGHNPTDLAANLRGLNLQVRTANGIPNPGIGEELLSLDSVSCVIEAGVHDGTVSFNQKLEELGIPHLWKEYGPGCHTPENFEREIAATIEVFAEEFADPSPEPPSFDYESIEPEFDVYGWHVAADQWRALEFMRLSGVDPHGLTVTGSGKTTITSPPLFAGADVVELKGATTTAAVPDPSGRITFSVDLGPADAVQEYTPGADPAERTRTVTFAPRYPAGGTPSTGGPGRAEEGSGDERRQARPACRVPKLSGATPKRARARLRQAGCRLGKVRRPHGHGNKVVAQHPKPGRRLPAGAKVGVRLG
jgi:S-formylglutathione hydrolase FrmB